MARKKQKNIGDQDFKVNMRNKYQMNIFSKCNTTRDENYVLERLAIPNLQNSFNMMSGKVSRNVFNQNDNVQRVEIRDMDSYIQFMKDSQIDSDASFFKDFAKII